MKRQLTSIIEKEGGGYVSICPEVDIASQGNSIEQARENLKEALELFLKRHLKMKLVKEFIMKSI